MFNPANLREFVATVSAAERGNKKEVRFSSDTARRVADDLTYLMLQLTQVQEQNIKLKEQLANSAVTNIELQGGTFS